MKNCKRLCSMAVTLLLCFLLVCPAYAADSSVPAQTDEILTDEEIYELEYERLLMEGMDDQAALLSLDDNNPDRNMIIDGAIKYYWYAIGNAITDTLFYEVDSPLSFQWQGSGSYRLATGNYSTSSNRAVNMTLGVIAGTYFDWSVPSVYIYEEGSSLRFAGIVKTNICGSWYNSSSFVSYDIVQNYGSPIVIYPDRMGILVNGELVTSVSSSADGTFEFDFNFEMTETVNSVAYRFYFDTTYKAPMYDESSMGISSRGLWLFIDDNAFAKYTVPDASTVVQKNILEQVKQIPSTIYNFFFGDSGDDAAEGFKSDMDSVTDEVDDIQQEIEEGLDKPDPEEIVPDLDGVVEQDSFLSYTNVFASVLQTGSMIADMMFVVCTFAFISYVLFGKKG